MKKKILFLITKSNFGGAQRYVFNLAKSLPKDKFEVVVALGGSGELNDRLNEENIKTVQIETLERNINISNEIKVLKRLITLIRKESPDLIHLNSSKIAGLGVLAGIFTNIFSSKKTKIVFTAHGWAFNENRSFFSKLIIKLIYWFVLFFVDKTIAVSDSIKNQVKNWPFIKNKVLVIKLGLEEFEMFEKNEARSLLNIPKDKSPIIGTIAELHPIKGLSYAIDAIKILKEKYPNIFYVICGEGEERECLESKIKSLKLENNMILKGNIYEAKKYLKAFDMFLLPSISEALSYALLEAGFAELPIVATNVGGIPEIILDSQMSLVEPRNALKMAQNIEVLLKDELLRKDSIAKIKQNITQNFSFHQSTQKTMDLYDRIIMS